VLHEARQFIAPRSGIDMRHDIRRIVGQEELRAIV